MFGILLSAINVALGWVFRSVLVKFVIFFALYFITVEFTQLLIGLLPSTNNINGAFSGITAATWYFLDLFAFSQGLPLLLSATSTRFIIRRIPVIG
jgi:hypothetical protein